ncbi:ABC transporter permease [Lacticaseibacillus pabuli]|uniref:ABC transporter permease n=1 Tax=Lacticaseibacillus pabuli TaxID=3025672 RepID=A0ABY7WS43_9LACO|nr:ABC transporter permease [Lacticaseibacillus sp. KACC 23028]WDF82624.1 ABC transporter permease [Lacticaseibacillus sp. KACC 23028]
MLKNNFARTGLLLRTYLRRDWLRILLWFLGLAGIMVAAAGKFDSLYGDPKALASISSTLKLPAMVSMFGPFTAAKPYNPAIIYAAEMMVFMGLFTAMMNIYFAVKNSRAEEDTGVSELISAHAVGRSAQLLAVTIEILLINLVIGVVEALGLQSAGMTGADANGSWLFGMGLAFFGIMFAAISLLCAQVVSSGRSATMLSYGVMGILYVARMATDVQNPDLTWFTVFGWIEKLNIYVTNTWWPLTLMIGFAVIVFGITFAIAMQRDVGSGILPQGNGRKNASPLLAGPFGLIARLERTSTIVWLIALFGLGASYGSIFSKVGDLLGSNPTMAKLIGNAAVTAANKTIVLSFAATLAVVFAVVSVVPAMMTVMRLNTDESKGYLEQLHARGISRLRLYSSHMAFALIVGSIALFLGIIGMGIGGNASMAHAIPLTRFLRSFVGYWPAFMVTIGFTALLAGALPRLQSVAWVVPIYGIMSTYVGKILDFPKWAMKVSPFGWVNQVPLKSINWGMAGWMSALGIVMMLAGYFFYRQRDLKIN